MTEEGNGQSLERSGSLDGLEGAARVFVSGKHAFVVSDDAAALGNPDPVKCLLYIIDVSDPAHPVLCASYESPGALVDVEVSGDIVYLAETAASKPDKEGQGMSFDFNCGGLRVLDISNPKGPREVGFFHAEGWVQGCACRDDKVYLGIQDKPYTAMLYMKEERCYRGRLYVIDVSDPKLPREVGRLDTEMGQRRMRLHQDRAFIVGDISEGYREYSGLSAVDVSDPGQLKMVASLQHMQDDRDVFVSGGLAYLMQEGATRDYSASDWDFFHGGLRVIDISNDAKPVDIGWISGRDMRTVEARCIVVVDGHAIIGGHGGFEVVDVTDPKRPRLVGGHDIKGGVRDIFVDKGLIYAAEGMRLGIYRLQPRARS